MTILFILGVILLILTQISDMYTTMVDFDSGEEANPFMAWWFSHTPKFLWWLPKLFIFVPIAGAYWLAFYTPYTFLGVGMLYVLTTYFAFLSWKNWKIMLADRHK